MCAYVRCDCMSAPSCALPPQSRSPVLSRVSLLSPSPPVDVASQADVDRGLTPVWAPLQWGPAQESRRGMARAYRPHTRLVPPRAATSASASPLKKLAVPASLDASGDWLQLEPSRKEGPARSQKEEEKGPPQGKPGEPRAHRIPAWGGSWRGLLWRTCPVGLWRMHRSSWSPEWRKTGLQCQQARAHPEVAGLCVSEVRLGVWRVWAGPQALPTCRDCRTGYRPCLPPGVWQRWGICSQHLMGRTAGVLAGSPCCQPGGGQGPGGHSVSQDVSASSHPLGTSRGCWAWQAYQDARASWGQSWVGPLRTTSGSRWAWFLKRLVLPLPQGGPRAQPA